MYSLGWTTECPDCSDEDDSSFAQAVAPMSHYLWMDEIAEYSAICAGATPFDVEASEENASPQSKSVSYKNAQLTIRWTGENCGYDGCTELELVY